MKLVNGYYFPDSDKQCSAAIFNEVYKIRKIADFCIQLDTVVQAGGNVGLFPVEMSKIFNKVITFEPDEENYNCLLKNIEGNNKIISHKLGLGDERCKATVYQPEHLDNCGSLALDVDPEGSVDVITIDSLNLDNVDLIYLDIEGGEYKTIQGAKTTISKFKPVIAIENKGLIPGFRDGGFQGSKTLRNWICSLGYQYVTRLMRDDVFIPV